MNYLSLFRKYRPKKFKDVVGQKKYYKMQLKLTKKLMQIFLRELKVEVKHQLQ